VEIRVTVGDVATYDGDGVVVNLFEGVTQPGGATAAVDRALEGAITAAIAHREIAGKRDEALVIHSLGKLPARLVLVAGLGKPEAFDLGRARGVTARAVRRLRDLGCRRVGTVVHGAGAGGLDPAASAQALAEGALLGLYAFERYKRPDEAAAAGTPKKALEVVELLERDAARAEALRAGAARGQVLAEGVNFARDLVNEPGITLTPTELAARAQGMAAEVGLECQVLDRGEMERLGMGGLLGIARGSQQPPQFIILRHRGGPPGGGPALGIVGKGITFDSGGISIKPAERMEEMKGDMAGGAAALGAMRAIARLRLPLDVSAYVPATENLPSGSAVKPGDILRAMDGTHIEVLNTDAEGRVVLADALVYARRDGCARLVDLATLTGACVVALGHVRSGAFTNDEAFLRQVTAASQAAGEKIWPLPMDEEYEELIKGEVGDVKNTGGRWGGAITAAKFLARFVDTTPWVHLDIAGTFLADKEKEEQPKGGTGVGVRTLVALASALAAEAG
jgi:leucyl aminopeptidase